MPSASGLAVLGELGELAGIDILNPDPSDWAIMFNGYTKISPDTVLKFEYRNESRVSDYPVEQGAFASYNKVATPFEIRMTMVCAGPGYVQNVISKVLGDNLPGIGTNNNMQRKDFLASLQEMLANSSELYTIVTPDMVYNNAMLDHYDYRKEANNGAIMIIAEAWFREIRVTASATYSNSGQPNVDSNSPSAADPVSAGKVSPGVIDIAPTLGPDGVPLG